MSDREAAIDTAKYTRAAFLSDCKRLMFRENARCLSFFGQDL